MTFASLASATLFCLSGISGVGGEEQPQPTGQEKTLLPGAELAISTGDLKTAKAFYAKLGFRETAAPAADEPVAAFTDGNIVLVLHQREFPSPTLIFRGVDLDRLSRQLADAGISADEPAGGSLAFTDPNGVRVVCHAQRGPRREEVAFEYWEPGKLPTPAKHFSRCGVFAEMAVAVEDRAAAAEFWSHLGFEKFHESDMPYPWGIYANGLWVLGMHQSKDFNGVGITFFSTDSADRIAALEQEGLTLTTRLDANNAILSAPDGEMLFIFGTP